MMKMLKSLKIGIDLQSLINDKLFLQDSNLLKVKPQKGALGSVTVLSEIFDLYLINKYKNIPEDEILRWLVAGKIDLCFRKVVFLDKQTQSVYLSNNINVTISSNNDINEELKDVSSIYFLEKDYIKNIDNQINKKSLWTDIVRDLVKFASVDDYEFEYNKNKR